MPRKTQIREKIKSLTLFDDVLFWKAAEDRDFCEEMLRILMEDPALIVLSNIPQRHYHNLQGRSIIVDCECLLSNGRITTIEVQNTDNVDHIRRVLYIGSVVSTNWADPGTTFSELPEVTVIYVTPFDIFGKGEIKYEVFSCLAHYGDRVDDKFHRFYINASRYDGSKLAKLMKVFRGDKEFLGEFPRIHNRIARFTETMKGKKEMSDFIQEVFGEDLQQAELRGEKRGEKRGENNAYTIIKQMYDKQCPKDEILEFLEKNIQKSLA